MKNKTIHYVIKHKNKDKYLSREYVEHDITSSSTYNIIFDSDYNAAESYTTIEDAIKDYKKYNCVYEKMQIFKAQTTTETKMIKINKEIINGKHK